MKFILFILLMFFVSSAGAQDTGAAGIKVGEAEFLPSARIEYVRNSNAYLTSTEEVESNGVVITPEAVFHAERRLLDVEFGYKGEFGAFSEDQLNYDDHELFASVRAELNRKHRLRANLSLSSEHQELGTGFTRGIATPETEAVRFSQVQLGSAYTFGSVLAKGNIVTGLNIRNVTYTSRDDLTEGSNFTQIDPYVQFSYRLSSETRAIIGLNLASTSFDNRERDRTDVELSTGLVLGGSGKTGGQASIGVVQEDYSDKSREDRVLFSARVNLNYSPTQYARFDLSASRELDNFDGGLLLDGQSQTIKDAAIIRWRHIWSSFLETRAFASFERQERDCPVESTDLFSGGVEVGYKPRRWLEAGVGVSGSSRTALGCSDSAADSSNLDFERQLALVFVKARL